MVKSKKVNKAATNRSIIKELLGKVPTYSDLFSISNSSKVTKEQRGIGWRTYLSGSNNSGRL